MLNQPVIHTIDREPILREIAADRKQHRDPSPDALGRVGIAFLVEIQHLPTAATPSTDEASPLRDDPQPISTAGMNKFPMGIGSSLVGQGHLRRKRGVADQIATGSASVGADTDSRPCNHSCKAAFT